ncbi:hypothetical protein SCB71_04025 [Herbiconiux sp. KACC 21604]|uniref:hypothetical protein n=1 Tax=unclassified Herbiconiux TaxID=2618217 RepID=UPI001492301D|nr:hypothetical protein [Herbiconiux sp. SALV-R1]QJU52541.1 hypothetical protein HL652_01990 [Herbiconiux sp. SALV-R1]WPO87416.1 hypothetical protein SCB71_04025 [Herbiconiux sp. KACC 21604]
MSEPEASTPGRVERSLAVMIVSVIGLSFICMVVVLIAGLATGGQGMNNAFWGMLAFIPWIGLPIGLVLMIVLLVLSMRRRLRDARGSR